MDLKDLAMQYLGKVALQQKNKNELIALVLELQKRDKDLFDMTMSSVERNKEKDKKIKEIEEKLVKVQAEMTDYKRVADLKLGKAYDVRATWIDKIVFILKAAERPLRSSEIISVLSNSDPFFRAMTDRQKGLSAHLTKALKYGRIIGKKQKGRNGYLFSLPDDNA